MSDPVDEGWQLRVRSGATPGEAVQIGSGLTLGRDAGRPGNLGGDDQLSRRHASLAVSSSGLTVEDLGSSNGTFVNDARITSPTVLRRGDRLRVGATHLEIEGGPGSRAETVIGQRAPARTADAVAAPLPASPTPPAYLSQPVGTHSATARRTLVGIIAVVVVLIPVALLFALHTSSSTASGANVPRDCGRSIGANGARVAYIAYVESNIARKGQNSVLAMPYDASMKPLPVSQCMTGGTGSTDLTDSGVLDANNQIAVDHNKNLLFAVNQGSDTIAVFEIQTNGALKPVDGSPFASGGNGPASVGISGDTLIVANKGQDGIRDLSKVAPNYSTFSVSARGVLKANAGSTIKVDPGSSPTDAYVPPAGGVAFSTEESGPIRAFTIGSDGALAEGPNSPQPPDDSAFSNGFDPAKKFGLGIVSHPTQPILYISYSTVPALAVYNYDATGKLTFQRAVLNGGSYLPCWNIVTPDGHFLYTANADTDNVSAFDLTDPAHPVQIQTFAFTTPGNPWNSNLDPSGKYLFVDTPRDTPKVPVGQGNTQHILEIGGDGKLTEVAGSPVKIPVPEGTQPQGLVVIDGTDAPAG